MNVFPMTLIRSGGLPLAFWEPLANGLPDWIALHNAEQQSAEQLLRAFNEALSSLSDSPLRTAVYNARKDFFQKRKTPSASFEATHHAAENLAQLFECLRHWHKNQQLIQAAENLFEQNLAANFRTLQAVCRAELLPRALLFASHDLLTVLPAFAEKQIEQFDKKDRNTALSLLQYLSRAVFKTSPFGRFTTVQVKALGSFQAQHDPIGDRLDFKPLVTPNVALLPAIYEVLLREPVFFQSLSVLLNPSISPLRGDLTEATWLYFDGEREAFQQIDPDPVVDLIVHELLKNQGSMQFQALIRFLEKEVDALPEQLNALLLRLIDIGLLEWQLPERGLSTGWCGGLYSYLGFLPSSTVLTEAAYLLQWMRTAARTMPFQAIKEAQILQQETLKAAKTFFEKYGGEMPPIQPQQVFFEDVAFEYPVDLPGGVIENLMCQLAECWRENKFSTLPPFRVRIFEFAQKAIGEGQAIDFLTFSQAFLAESNAVQKDLQDTKSRIRTESVYPHQSGKIGVMLQIFKKNGGYKAVVNAIFPGGGKLFARWLPLFPAEVSEQLKIWENSAVLETVAFPWQGWSNANFQPTFSTRSLAVPGGRVGHIPGGSAILLGDLAVRKDEYGFPQLIEKNSNKPVVFTDLGLEAPETRSPVMQVLWHLGVPFVSSEALMPEGNRREVDGIHHRPRLEIQSLILARAAWELQPEVWRGLFSKGRSQAERIGFGISRLKALGIPSQFFGRFTGIREKPQYFDLESPISMILLEKNLKVGKGNFLLTEMLPTPECWLGDRVGEFVVELQVTSS